MRLLKRNIVPAAILCLLFALPATAKRLPRYPETDVNLIAERTNAAKTDKLIKNGKYLFRYMRYSEAVRFLSEATNLSASISYETAFLDAANTLALLLNETARTQESLDLFQRLLLRARSLARKNGQIVADLQNNMCLVEIAAGRPAEAIFSQLREAARANRDPAKALTIENNRCLLLIRTGQADKALPALKKTVRKAENKGYFEPLIRGLLLIADASVLLNNSAAAEKAFRQALDRAEFWGYKKGMAETLDEMSSYYEEKGDAVRALEYAEALLATHESMNAVDLLAADRGRIKKLQSGP